ncbi:hypothetical protein AAC387_Pa04g2152 [Persea americana]
MESISAAEKQNMVSLFLEIAVGQSAETARQFLQATSWKLEEAIQLFYIGNEGGLASSSFSSPPIENVPPVPNQNLGKEIDVGNANVGQDVGNEEVRPPLPVKREVLYDDASLYRNQRMGSSAHEANSVVAFRNFDEELKRPGIWESDQNGASTTDSSRDNLASLYRPPFALMHQGPFEKAKTEAAFQDKWLLVNLQSTKEFSSHMLNRDTWANEAVAQTISTNFIFWQVYDDTSEGRKVCTYYNLVSIPVILVIDPITGQKLRSWNGMIQPESLLEDLLPFMDRGPKDHHVVLPHKRPRESAPTVANKIKARLVATDEVTEEEDEEISRALAASMEDVNAIRPTPIDDEKTDKKPEVGKEAETYLSEKPNYPTLPEEPKGDRSLLCRVRVRLPDGRTCQRNFLRSDPIQLLWSFCSSQLDEGEARQFRMMQAIPGASNSLDYESKLTFEESGLSNSVVSVTWK